MTITRNNHSGIYTNRSLKHLFPSDFTLHFTSNLDKKRSQSNKLSYSHKPLVSRPAFPPQLAAYSLLMTQTRHTTAADLHHFPFPHEVLIQILGHLSHDDILSLAWVDRAFREKMRPYIFASVRLSWDFIMEKFPLFFQQGQKRNSEGQMKLLQEASLNTRDDKNVKKYVESVSIVTPNIQHEWNFRFDTFAHEFDNIRHLTVKTEGSSNFFKYTNVMPQIESLELITDAADERAIFNLNHCKPFPALKHLTINGFLLDFDEEDTEGLNLQVKILDLINCSWNYPFQLKSFGSEIITLRLTYHNHQFILSERFREFLHNPNLPQLQYLTISNQNNLKLHITYRIMNFLRNIPALKRLYLLGNIYNETINNFTIHDMENKIRYIMNVNDVKIFYSSFVDA
ncbi:CYFA0S07e05072g1_1 [Cyberlindnera fabianii]|uniref:CYFA0S07e05072g1_1 n=2 Tax=Cyberlindnera fabianii TaxID=36022 RepID=A0A061AVM6_CYBFA|nr:CYFA0S07e05072g1_1 [Cyberlindnera fabianii]